MSEFEDQPSFDVVTDIESDIKVVPSKSMHARQLGGSPKELVCEIGGFPRCKNPFKNSQGLGNHIRTQHPRTEVFGNDIIRIGFPTRAKPYYDKKRKIFVYDVAMNIPKGYVIHRIEDRMSYGSYDNGSDTQLINVICTKSVTKRSEDK